MKIDKERRGRPYSQLMIALTADPTGFGTVDPHVVRIKVTLASISPFDTSIIFVITFCQNQSHFINSWVYTLPQTHVLTKVYFTLDSPFIWGIYLPRLTLLSMYALPCSNSCLSVHLPKSHPCLSVYFIFDIFWYLLVCTVPYIHSSQWVFYTPLSMCALPKEQNKFLSQCVSYHKGHTYSSINVYRTIRDGHFLFSMCIAP